MRVLKALCLFLCLTALMGGVCQNSYAGEKMEKAPQEDNRIIELNDHQTIDELKKIINGEFEGHLSGRIPVSVETPKGIGADYGKVINDMNRGIKQRTFRAPAISRPQSITISQGI